MGNSKKKWWNNLSIVFEDSYYLLSILIEAKISSPDHLQCRKYLVEIFADLQSRNYSVFENTLLSKQYCLLVIQLDIEPRSYVDSSESAFVFKSINIDEVYNALNNLKTSKSLGPDKIPARLLKDSCFSIAPFLTQIFNASLASSVFPQDWKIARVSPIYKAGDK